MKGCMPAVLVAFTSVVWTGQVCAEVYRVGPGEKYARVSQVAGRLQPGDVVEITGDVDDSIELFKDGSWASPITIRGVTRVERGAIIRPKITFPENASCCIKCTGDNYVIEGLDISGALGATYATATAIHYAADNLTVRNCRIHHNRQGILGDYGDSGSILVEFCEFDSSGGSGRGGGNMRMLSLNSPKPGAQAVIQYCYIHDATGDEFIKSRCTRNVVRYNWFENHSNTAVYIIDALRPQAGTQEGLYPMHSDIVGNVFFFGWSPGRGWKTVQIGGEGDESAGTEGDFNIAHNLFITTANPAEPSSPIYANGNIDRVRLYNNVFLAYGVPRIVAFKYENSWPEAARTSAFVRRRGGAQPILEGSNNWTSTRNTTFPEAFTNTLQGLNPKFIDMLKGDFRPRKDSPLAGAGAWPLPSGRIAGLAPEYEPQRGIPVDLKPRPRRKVTPPSIGPFEAEE